MNHTVEHSADIGMFAITIVRYATGNHATLDAQNR